MKSFLWQFREDAFVEDEHDGIVLRDGCAENGFEESMRAHGLPDVSAQSVLGHHLGGLEPPHVLPEGRGGEGGREGKI